MLKNKLHINQIFFCFFKALPRQVWFDNATQSNLIQWPVEEFSDLRRSNVSVNNVVLESGSLFEVSGGSGAQVKFSAPMTPSPFR